MKVTIADKLISLQTTAAIKSEVGYEMATHNCGNCLLHRTIDDPIAERSWIETCTLLESSIGVFPVELSAKCRMWRAKGNKQKERG